MSRRRRRVVNRQIVVACIILSSFVVVAIMAPQWAPPDDPAKPGGTRLANTSLDPIPRPPSDDAPLGTSTKQVDVYYSLVWGARSALRFGLIVTLSAAVIGILVGAISGYSGGVVQGLLMHVTDAFLAFPAIAGVWLLRQVMQPATLFSELTPIQQAFVRLGLDPVLLTLILLSWMPYARLASARIAQLRQTEYVEAARSLGMRNVRIIRRHLIPNALPPLIVLIARDVGAVVILAAAFTFIGLGESTEWGTLLVIGRDYVIGLGGNPLTYWWVFVPATLALILFGVGWNLLGDGLTSALDPYGE